MVSRILLFGARFLKRLSPDLYVKFYFIVKHIKERKVKSFLSRYITSDSYIVDIGSNVGYFSDFFCQICNKGKIIGFEPNRDLIKYLSIIKKSYSNFEFYNIALGNENTVTKFYFSSWLDVDNRTYSFSESTGSHKVEMKIFDHFYQYNKLDFIKIDVQGFELQVLKGMQNSIKKFKPIIYTEIWPQGLNDSKTKIDDFELFFNKLNYKIYEIKNDVLVEFDWSKVKSTTAYFEDFNIICFPA